MRRSVKGTVHFNAESKYLDVLVDLQGNLALLKSALELQLAKKPNFDEELVVWFEGRPILDETKPLKELGIKDGIELGFTIVTKSRAKEFRSHQRAYDAAPRLRFDIPQTVSQQDVLKLPKELVKGLSSKERILWGALKNGTLHKIEKYPIKNVSIPLFNYLLLTVRAKKATFFYMDVFLAIKHLQERGLLLPDILKSILEAYVQLFKLHTDRYISAFDWVFQSFRDKKFKGEKVLKLCCEAWRSNNYLLIEHIFKNIAQNLPPKEPVMAQPLAIPLRMLARIDVYRGEQELWNVEGISIKFKDLSILCPESIKALENPNATSLSYILQESIEKDLPKLFVFYASRIGFKSGELHHQFKGKHAYYTPLKFAIKHQLIEIVKAILSTPEGVDSLGYDLDIAVSATRDKDLELLKIIIKAKPDTLLCKGVKPFELAARLGELEFVEAMLPAIEGERLRLEKSFCEGSPISINLQPVQYMLF